MLDSVRSILEAYLDGVSRYAVYSVEMERGENPEDLYYLCLTDDGAYVVIETDYFSSFAHVADEVGELFDRYGAHPLHWLVKKDRQTFEVGTLPLDQPTDEAVRQLLILQSEHSYLRHGVLAVHLSTDPEKRRNPVAYGFSK